MRWRCCDTPVPHPSHIPHITHPPYCQMPMIDRWCRAPSSPTYRSKPRSGLRPPPSIYRTLRHTLLLAPRVRMRYEYFRVLLAGHTPKNRISYPRVFAPKRRNDKCPSVCYSSEDQHQHGQLLLVRGSQVLARVTVPPFHSFIFYPLCFVLFSHRPLAGA